MAAGLTFVSGGTDQTDSDARDVKLGTVGVGENKPSGAMHAPAAITCDTDNQDSRSTNANPDGPPRHPRMREATPAPDNAWHGHG